MRDEYSLSTKLDRSRGRDANAQPKDWTAARLTYELRIRGLTWIGLALSSGLHGTTLWNATRRHYPRAERIIADALGKRPQQIWPSRYQRRRARRAEQAVQGAASESSAQAQAQS